MQPIVSDTGYRHILMMKRRTRHDSRARGMKVEYIVTITNHQKLTPEEICTYWPFLTLGQVHSALAYYYDNKEEVERLIKEGDEFVEEWKRQNAPAHREFVKRMKERAKAAEGRREGPGLKCLSLTTWTITLMTESLTAFGRAA